MTNGIESNLKTSAQHLKKIKKGKITEWEKIFASYSSDRDQFPECIKN
jgi:hypothetical protein